MIDALKRWVNAAALALGFGPAFTPTVFYHIQISADPPLLKDVQHVASNLSQYEELHEKGYLEARVREFGRSITGRDAARRICELWREHGLFIVDGSAQYELPRGEVVSAVDVPPQTPVVRMSIKGHLTPTA